MQSTIGRLLIIYVESSGGAGDKARIFCWCKSLSFVTEPRTSFRACVGCWAKTWSHCRAKPSHRTLNGREHVPYHLTSD